LASHPEKFCSVFEPKNSGLTDFSINQISAQSIKTTRAVWENNDHGDEDDVRFDEKQSCLFSIDLMFPE